MSNGYQLLGEIILIATIAGAITLACWTMIEVMIYRDRRKNDKD